LKYNWRNRMVGGGWIGNIYLRAFKKVGFSLPSTTLAIGRFGGLPIFFK